MSNIRVEVLKSDGGFDFKAPKGSRLPKNSRYQQVDATFADRTLIRRLGQGVTSLFSSKKLTDHEISQDPAIANKSKTSAKKTKEAAKELGRNHKIERPIEVSPIDEAVEASLVAGEGNVLIHEAITLAKSAHHTPAPDPHHPPDPHHGTTDLVGGHHANAGLALAAPFTGALLSLTKLFASKHETDVALDLARKANDKAGAVLARTNTGLGSLELLKNVISIPAGLLALQSMSEANTSMVTAFKALSISSSIFSGLFFFLTFLPASFRFTKAFKARLSLKNLCVDDKIQVLNEKLTVNVKEFKTKRQSIITSITNEDRSLNTEKLKEERSLSHHAPKIPAHVEKYISNMTHPALENDSEELKQLKDLFRFHYQQEVLYKHELFKREFGERALDEALKFFAKHKTERTPELKTQLITDIEKGNNKLLILSSIKMLWSLAGLTSAILMQVLSGGVGLIVNLVINTLSTALMLGMAGFELAEAFKHGHATTLDKAVMIFSLAVTILGFILYNTMQAAGPIGIGLMMGFSALSTAISMGIIYKKSKKIKATLGLVKGSKTSFLPKIRPQPKAKNALKTSQLTRSISHVEPVKGKIPKRTFSVPGNVGIAIA